MEIVTSNWTTYYLNATYRLLPPVFRFRPSWRRTPGWVAAQWRAQAESAWLQQPLKDIAQYMLWYCFKVLFKLWANNSLYFYSDCVELPTDSHVITNTCYLKKKKTYRSTCTHRIHLLKKYIYYVVFYGLYIFAG